MHLPDQATMRLADRFGVRAGRQVEDGQRVHDRGILYAPDYVINAGGIINVGLEYLGHGDEAEVMARIARIPERLEQVWAESAASGEPASEVADRIARGLIGRA